LTSRFLIPAPVQNLLPEDWAHALIFATPTPLPDYVEPWWKWADRLQQAAGNVFDVPKPELTQTFESWADAFFKANG
jgi:hypothetical protein